MIKRVDRDYKQFVHNCETEIRRLCHPDSWIPDVAGDDNPADLPSRVVSTSLLLKSFLWWNGASWLTLQPLPQSIDPPAVNDFKFPDIEERKPRLKETNVETAQTIVQPQQSIGPLTDL